MTVAPCVLFLPGASGDGRFWRPVAERLPAEWDKTFFDWPGLGRIPCRPDVAGLGDLARLVLERADHGSGPVDLVAQSMGGVVAAMVELARPDRVRRLVLTATSAGIDAAGGGWGLAVGCPPVPADGVVSDALCAFPFACAAAASACACAGVSVTNFPGS